MLVAERGTDVAAVENEVPEEPATTVLHEDALMLVTSSSGHLKDDVHQGSSLRYLPVNARRAAADLAEVDNEVSDGAEAGSRRSDRWQSAYANINTHKLFWLV